MNNKYNNAELLCGGLKCDNKECDYIDLSVDIRDYKQYLNKPCPKCGCNLLTQDDYNNVQTILALVEALNNTYIPQEYKTKEKNTITLRMDGSSYIDIDIEEGKK